MDVISLLCLPCRSCLPTLSLPSTISRLEAELADILWNGQPVEEPEGGRLSSQVW